MHSKIVLKHARRMTPFLVTAGLGLSVAAHATEPETPADGMTEIPAPTIDTDGDGTADAWDRSGDGQPDAWDTDGDGRPDLVDDNADGQPD